MSKGVFSVHSQLNEGSIYDKVQEITHNTGVQIDIAQQFINIVNPYVPCDTGNLSREVYITRSYSDGMSIVYEAPYASKCYYGDDINFRKDKHPLATAHWDKVAMQTERERFVREAEQIVKARAKEVNNG